jgi:hypothetical protein
MDRPLGAQVSQLAGIKVFGLAEVRTLDQGGGLVTI